MNQALRCELLMECQTMCTHCFLIFQTQKWIASPWPIAVSSYEELLSFIPWHRNLDFELHRQALCMIIIVNIIIILSFTINTLCGQAAHRSAAFRIAPWCCSSSYCQMLCLIVRNQAKVCLIVQKSGKAFGLSVRPINLILSLTTSTQAVLCILPCTYTGARSAPL